MNLTQILTVLCVGVYAVCTYRLWRHIGASSGDYSAKSPAKRALRLFALVGLGIHTCLLGIVILDHWPVNVSLGLTLSLAGWISLLLYLLMSIRPGTFNLGIIMFPIGIITVLLTGMPGNASAMRSGTEWHIILAIPTYGVMCVAFAQACLLIIQDRRLNKISPNSLTPALPPMETMEKKLILLTAIGFGLMTLNVIFGFGANSITKGEFIEFNHHVVLSVLAWLSFGLLLIARKYSGWRGEVAAKWTIFAFIILVLAYFGTRFVTEVIL